MKHYDYIFAGGGLAALMTLYRMAGAGLLQGKNVLVIDPDDKTKNDRTWCFWEEGKGEWDSIVIKKWETALFANAAFTRQLDFGSYTYKMINGIDFYNFVLPALKQHNGIDFLQERVMHFEDKQTHVSVKTEHAEFTSGILLNSIYNPESVKESNYPLIQQHFTGWHIKAGKPVFNDGQATFMDFSVPQKGNTRFMYVLPTSAREALVEYTLFSENLLPEQEYEEAITDYLAEHNMTGFEILHTEKGSIPMTAYPFWEANTKNIIHIGTAGGWTKASTGFTFMSSSKKSARLVRLLAKQDHDFRQFKKKDKYWFYDLLLLDVLYHTNEKGAAIFSSMFRDGKAALILKFLDDETSLAEDLKVILKCPKTPFLKALARQMF